MDAAEIVTALVEGAAACRRRTVSPLLYGAYQHLKRLTVGTLPEREHALADAAATDPQGGVGPLAEALRRAGADRRKDLHAAAWRLKNLLHPPGTGQDAAGPGPLNAVGGGIAPVRGKLAAKSGYQPSPFSGLDEDGRIAGYGAEPASPLAGLLLSQGSQTLNRGADERARLLGDCPRHACGLVILIEECDGIQVGNRNEQLTVYRVTVAAAALATAPELAGLLLAAGTPWSRDVFAHDAGLPPRVPPGQSDRDARALVPGPGGNVLVIVRNSHGVQVGDRNVQHNRFHIRVAAASVWPEEVELTRARRDAVTRLHNDPEDRDAARLLAADIARAAGASLQADLRARLTLQVGSPYVPGTPGELIKQTGRQVGAHGRARVRIEVEDIKAFDADALVSELTDAARYVKALETDLAQTAEVPPTEPPSATAPAPRRLPPLSAL